MTVNKNPCYKCVERAVGCHGWCDRYIGWTKAEAEKREAIAQFKKEEVGFLDYQEKAKRRLQRWQSYRKEK